MNIRTIDLEQRQAGFIKALRASHGAVWKIAQWLQCRGYSVTIPPTAEAANHAERMDYADNGDLYIAQRVEVKHLSAQFTSAQDWPFKPKFIVCAKHSFDQASPKPYAYVILSKDQRTMAIVDTKTRKNWYVESRSDKRRSGMQDFYLAPLESVTFVTLEAISND